MIVRTNTKLCLAAVSLVALVCRAHGQEIQPADFGWMTHRWAATDPNLGLSQRMARECKAVSDKKEWVEGLRGKAYLGVKQRLRYIVAAYLVRKDYPDYSLHDAFGATLWLGQEDSWEVARARFLVSSPFLWDYPMFGKLGERLLSAKEDFDVRYELAKVKVTYIMENKVRYERALAFAQDLAKRYPQVGKVHSVLGSAYFSGLVELRIASNRAKSIAEFKAYLASDPPRCTYVERTKTLVRLLQNGAITQKDFEPWIYQRGPAK